MKVILYTINSDTRIKTQSISCVKENELDSIFHRKLREKGRVILNWWKGKNLKSQSMSLFAPNFSFAVTPNNICISGRHGDEQDMKASFTASATFL